MRSITTTSLRIVDLDFCQVVTEQAVQVIGGITTTSGFLPEGYLYKVSKIREFDNYQKKLVYSDPSTGVVVNELNPETGIGYEVLASDDDSQSNLVVFFTSDPSGESRISGSSSISVS
jgi:hypothetical protein